jgi:thiol-disulfide isomerase/thioredoxin
MLSGARVNDRLTMLYALHESRGLAGFRSVSADELEKPVTLTLKPACHVHGRLASSGLAALGRTVGWTNVYVHRDGQRPLSCDSQAQRYEFYLPPGSYELEAYGTDLEEARRRIEIEPGRRELALDAIDLRPEKLVTLLGRPGPELERISAWKNGGPVRLADLRGKFVLLDFWGHWCAPCLRAMPCLMALHDAFADQGLVVIAVHDGTAKSIAEIDEQIAPARRRQWFGRDLPFLVALDGDGSTIDAYGITSFPTSLLIDRDGKVVQRLEIGPGRINSLEEELSRRLGVAREQPPWRDRFAQTYALEPTQALRYLKPPFASERARFITGEINARGNQGPADVGLVLRWNGTIRPGVCIDPHLPFILRSIAADEGGHLPPADTFALAEGLKGLPLPGDWVIREGTTVDARLEAFQHAVKEGLGRSIRCERRRVTRDVIVVSGRYPSPRPVSGEPPLLHLSADNRDLDSEIGGGEGTLAELLSSLSIVTGLRVVDESTDSATMRVRWVQHDSSLDRGRLAELLANLSKQTSLELRRQQRPVDVWSVIEE